jgi:hypothetical protein
MAYIADQEDKLLDPNDPQQAQAQAAPQQSAAPLSSQGGNDLVSGQQGAGAASTAGIGKGGFGGWTNIQAYLGANKDDTGSAQNLEQKVGGQFSKEKTDLTTGAEKAKTTAQAVAGSVTQAKDNADEWLKQGASAYDWSGNHGDPYKQNVSKLQGALTADYSGPRTYDYGFSGDTQKYGEALKDRGGFDKMMGDLYQERAGGQLSAGGRTLQNQLDVNNENLSKTREKLLQDYSGLGNLRDQTVTDTTKSLSDAEQQYRSNQNILKDFLSNKSGELDSSIGQQEAKAKYDYENAYKNSQSGRASALDGTGAAAEYYGPRGISVNGNMTWEQLEAEQNASRNNVGDYGVANANYSNPNVIGMWPLIHNRTEENKGALDKWYGEQDSKYGNVADEEERKWNMIQDVLKSEAERKKQGFSVRGK